MGSKPHSFTENLIEQEEYTREAMAQINQSGINAAVETRATETREVVASNAGANKTVTRTRVEN